jgi:hypothetical protein
MSDSASGFVFVDPRPIAAEAPYTYYLPPPEKVAAVEPGDLVKVLISAVPPSEEFHAERVWVCVASIEGDRFEGVLDSSPSDIPALKKGDALAFDRHLIIDTFFVVNPAKEDALPPDPRRWYWGRCLVEKGVVDGDLLVHYLYREEPDMAKEGDKDPDSGWRIRGDMRNCSDEELEAREVQYIAIGRVLNSDDSWLQLIDEPIGSAFVRDFKTGRYERVDRG